MKEECGFCGKQLDTYAIRAEVSGPSNSDEKRIFYLCVDDRETGESTCEYLFLCKKVDDDEDYNSGIVDLRKSVSETETGK